MPRAGQQAVTKLPDDETGAFYGLSRAREAFAEAHGLGGIPMAERVVLVGESNPYGGNDDFALYPHPEGCSGWRLCCVILGMRRADYLRSFERVNLCRGAWNMAEARGRAAGLRDRRLVLCGAKVCRAFGVPFRSLETPDREPPAAMRGYVVLNHPSGRCLAWNEPGAAERAREAVAAFAPELAPLLGLALAGGEMERAPE